jgi:hypothetical protein
MSDIQKELVLSTFYMGGKKKNEIAFAKSIKK